MSRSPRDHAKSTDPFLLRLMNAARRVTIGVTTRAIWQVMGYRIGNKTETIQAEAFTGIGFYSRPPVGSNPEAVLLNLNGADHPVLVATRDEQVRKSIAQLEADETAIFTSQSIVLIKADGTVEIRSKSGTALPLATKADLIALKAWIDTHSHAGAGAVPTFPLSPSPTGTIKFKAE